MTLFRFPFLRRLLRKKMKPIEEDKAVLWKKRLALGYMLLAWNAFGFVCYQIYQGKGDWVAYHGLRSQEEMNMTQAEQWAKAAGVKKAHVYKIHGFTVTEYDIDNEK